MVFKWNGGGHGWDRRGWFRSGIGHSWDGRGWFAKAGSCVGVSGTANSATERATPATHCSSPRESSEIQGQAQAAAAARGKQGENVLGQVCSDDDPVCDRLPTPHRSNSLYPSTPPTHHPIPPHVFQVETSAPGQPKPRGKLQLHRGRAQRGWVRAMRIWSPSAAKSGR